MSWVTSSLLHAHLQLIKTYYNWRYCTFSMHRTKSMQRFWLTKWTDRNSRTNQCEWCVSVQYNLNVLEFVDFTNCSIFEDTGIILVNEVHKLQVNESICIGEIGLHWALVSWSIHPSTVVVFFAINFSRIASDSVTEQLELNTGSPTEHTTHCFSDRSINQSINQSM